MSEKKFSDFFKKEHKGGWLEPTDKPIGGSDVMPASSSPEEIKRALSAHGFSDQKPMPTPLLEVKANLDDIKASDDLVQRARNIVLAVGIQGTAGDYVLAVHEVLQRYERADRASSAGQPNLRIASSTEKHDG